MRPCGNPIRLPGLLSQHRPRPSIYQNIGRYGENLMLSIKSFAKLTPWKFSLFWSLIVFWGSPLATPSPASAFDPHSIVAAMQRKGVTAASWVHIRNSMIVDRDARGVGPETLFQVASLSKTASAALVLILAQKGVLDLDRPIPVAVAADIGARPSEGSQITLRTLLSHRAGINVPGFWGYDRTQPPPSLEDILNGRLPARSPGIKVSWPVGQQFRYSGGGYLVAQQVLVLNTRARFEALAREHLFRPLNMHRSTFTLAPMNLPLAVGHDARGRPLPNGWRVYPESAAAGLWATAADLARLVVEIMRALDRNDGAVLEQASARQMLSSVEGYGLGVFVQKTPGGEPFFWNSGANAGFRALLVGFPQSGSGGVILTNSDNGDAVCLNFLQQLNAHVRLSYPPWPGEP